MHQLVLQACPFAPGAVEPGRRGADMQRGAQPDERAVVGDLPGQGLSHRGRRTRRVSLARESTRSARSRSSGLFSSPPLPRACVRRSLYMTTPHMLHPHRRGSIGLNVRDFRPVSLTWAGFLPCELWPAPLSPGCHRDHYRPGQPRRTLQHGELTPDSASAAARFHRRPARLPPGGPSRVRLR